MIRPAQPRATGAIIGVVAVVIVGSVSLGWWLAVRRPRATDGRFADDENADRSGTRGEGGRAGGRRGPRGDSDSEFARARERSPFGVPELEGENAPAGGAAARDPDSPSDPSQPPGAPGGGADPGGDVGGTGAGASGGGGAAGAPSGSAPGARPTPLQGGTSSAPAAASGTPTAAKDPSSDTTAPSLMSVRFEPPEVRAGQASIVRMEVIDDLAGVAGVYGRLSSPAGAGISFSALREGDSNIFAVPVTIPKDGEQGLWWISLLSLVDKAANTSTVSYTPGSALPGATLRVISANSDTAPPTVRSVALGQPSLGDGETQVVIVDAVDDRSGLANIYGTFESPQKAGLLAFQCPISGPGPFSGWFAIPKDAACGEWRLRELHLQDHAGNHADFDGSNPAVASARFTVVPRAGKCDASAPAVRSVRVAPRSVSNEAASEIAVTVDVTDDASGVASMDGRVDGPIPPGGGNRPMLPFYSSQAGPTADGPWVGTLTVPKFSAKGTWRVGYLHVADRAQNNRFYTDPSDPALAGGDFEVH